MEEEQNQPEVMQELLLKLMNDLQILKGIQQEKEKPAAQSFTPYGNFSMIDDVEVLMKDIYTFLRKFNDDDDFEDIEYVSLEEVNNDQEEKEFDLEDILQIQDVILREKLLNINRLIANIESLNDNPSPDRVFKSPSSVPIPVTDSDSFFEESDTSLSHLDNSLPEFEPFSDDTEETRSGSTTTHANNSLPEYDSFLF
ncbi:hypothetical protein Tco_0359560 [Tanacetum coccineum]